MRNFDDKMVIYDLRETYTHTGIFEFKIILDKSFKNGHDIEVEMFDPKNVQMDLNFNTWGRKINCEFKIPVTAEEGVYTVTIKLHDMTETAQYWVIK